ncbi:hypothetical protein [Enterovibrio calviensis]|uniref:hypothetical protein n=1 Tax=Enterovibrio calviensis TaxID=91359 RepID=UPI000480DCF6|nr:hypothetical protein [Enterovibrio calviensis]
MKITTTSAELIANSLMKNADFLIKQGVKNDEHFSILSASLDRGTHIVIEIDGQKAAWLQVVPESMTYAILHGYVWPEFRDKSKDLYSTALAYVKKTSIEKVGIYCNSNVRNFLLKRLNFKDKKSGEGFFIVEKFL